MWAARNGHVEVVKLLLAHGADVGAKTTEGDTALTLAEQRNQEEIAGLLRAHAAK
jgi:ankyrin repeat protein